LFLWKLIDAFIVSFLIEPLLQVEPVPFRDTEVVRQAVRDGGVIGR
jgi:hypothetical protein